MRKSSLWIVLGIELLAGCGAEHDKDTGVNVNPVGGASGSNTGTGGMIDSSGMAAVGGASITAGAAAAPSIAAGAGGATAGSAAAGSAGTAGAAGEMSAGGMDAGTMAAGDASSATPGEIGPPPADVSHWAARGPYTVTMIDNSGPDGTYKIFVPTPLGMNGAKHPIVTWGNGVGTTVSRYMDFVEHMASHGILVVAVESPSTGSGDQMKAGIDWAIAENDRAGSMFMGKLDTGAVGSVGHSMGGIGAVIAAHHPKVTTAVVIAGGDSTITSLTIPIFLVGNGSDELVNVDVFLQPQFDMTPDAEFVYGVCKGVMHEEIMKPMSKEHGYVTAWLDFKLNGNLDAGGVFYGPDCTLCKDPGWTVQRKNVPGT